MTKFRAITTITFLLGLAIAGTTQAATEHLNLPVCNLAVYPFNSTQPEIYSDAAKPLVNFLTESVCKARTTYGQSYKQPPIVSENPTVKLQDIDQKNVPFAQHYHSYVNNSLQDKYYYRSFIDKFEIKLQSDALNNVDKNNIQCQTPAPGSFSGSASDIADCNGQITDINFYGGVKVSYDSSTGVVTWEFGTVDKNKRPAMWGNNNDKVFTDALSSVYGVPADLSDANSLYRKFTPSVTLKSNKNSDEIWSATTTSKVLLRNYAILKTSFTAILEDNKKFSALCSNLGDFTKWCPVATPAGQNLSTENIGQQEWFWFPIGSVVSVWRQPVNLACADLQWDGSFLKLDSKGNLVADPANPNALLANEAALLKIKPIFQNGTGTQRPLEYHWVAFSGNATRPAWFTNEDTFNTAYLELTTGASLLRSTLPGTILQIAHAAVLPATQQTTITQPSNAGAAVTTFANIINLGKFKDEFTSTQSSNPLTDTDLQAYFTGGSDGVTLGVQAYYADGKNIINQGPMSNLDTGIRQKAKDCHLELTIKPGPATCIKLDLSPKDIKPNTPVTFTVTPTFSPAGQIIPLNYAWNATANKSTLNPPSTKLPGDSTTRPGSFDAGTGDNNVRTLPEKNAGLNKEGLQVDLCPGGNCGTTAPDKAPNPGGPIENIGNGTFANPVDSRAIITPGFDLNQIGFNALGANIFAADLTTAFSDTVDKDSATAQELLYGGFKDYKGGPGTPANPFLETTDNKTYYTGGPSGTLITVQGQAKDGTIFQPCKDSLIIPAGAICKQLAVKFMDGTVEVAQDKLVAGKTYTIVVDKAKSVKTDGTAISQYVIYLNNAGGPGTYGTLKAAVGNAASCSAITGAAGTIGTDQPTSVDCQYLFTPNAGDHIKIQANPEDGVPACTLELTIPGGPAAICKSLNLTTSPLISGNKIAPGQTVALTTDPRDTVNAPRPPVVYTETGKGYFVADSANNLSCTLVPANADTTITFEAPATCKYAYQASNTPGSADTMSIKVKQDDAVPACSQNFTVTPTTGEEICLNLNLQVNGSYTLKPELLPGVSYSLQTAPVTTLGNNIVFVEWDEHSDGMLIGNPNNPAICPTFIDNATLQTPSFCDYFYSSSINANNLGFSVHAVPDDNQDSCKAQAKNYNPPKQPPYCQYLDLSYNQMPFNGTNADLTAVVVMSDGSKYPDKVRFASNDGSGQFTGGFNPLLDNGTSNFRSSTDSNNSTTPVHYNNGSGFASINVTIADTNIPASAACQRRINPTTQPPRQCTVPPTIVRNNGNTYTAQNGDSLSYCWSISGPGNPVFSNGQNTVTNSNTVTLRDNYTDFNLEVHDCNPDYRYYCSDTYQVSGTPHIEKQIRDASKVTYGTSVNYSTTGSGTTKTVEYKITFTPSNYQPGSFMTAKIFDPAFTGTLQGYKTNADGLGKQQGGSVDFTNINQTLKINGSSSPICSDQKHPDVNCHLIDKSGYLYLSGINSSNPISIEYSGQLHTGITLEDCRKGIFCNEKFLNQSYVTEMTTCTQNGFDSNGIPIYICTVAQNPNNDICQFFYNDRGEKVAVNGQNQDCDETTYTIASNTTQAELVCQYFLTRASGDVFLEDQLVYGIDVSKCYPFKNVSSIITKPIPRIDFEAPKTGTPDAVVTINHEICSSGQNNFANISNKLNADQLKKLKEIYGADVSTLSSQICEVGLVPGLVWTKDQINATISQNIGKLTRWISDINPGNSIIDVSEITNQGGRVYYYKGQGSGKDLVTIGTLYQSLNIEEGKGSLTIVIEDADLQINNDINYVAGTQPTDAKMISSLGVIVINGNIYVDKNVKTLSGAYFLQRTDSNDISVGNIFSGTASDSGQDSEVPLTIYGSVYGNIGPLYEHRTGTGSVSQDQGSITIRYDQRIIQNPPEGLSEILGDFSQSQVAQ